MENHHFLRENQLFMLNYQRVTEKINQTLYQFYCQNEMTNHQTSKAKFFTVTVKLFDVVDRATP
jgi:hypothetical protein